MTLVEFLLARIAQDERAWLDKELAHYPPGADLDKAEANLRGTMIGQGTALSANMRRLAVAGWEKCPWHHLGDAWLRNMTRPYADHPDYRQEWAA